jgi:hypothetical protein
MEMYRIDHKGGQVITKCKVISATRYKVLYDIGGIQTLDYKNSSHVSWHYTFEDAFNAGVRSIKDNIKTYESLLLNEKKRLNEFKMQYSKEVQNGLG